MKENKTITGMRSYGNKEIKEITKQSNVVTWAVLVVSFCAMLYSIINFLTN